MTVAQDVFGSGMVLNRTAQMSAGGKKSNHLSVFLFDQNGRTVAEGKHKAAVFRHILCSFGHIYSWGKFGLS